MPKVDAFPREAVRLLDGPVKDRQSLAARYLLELDVDRLLHNFRCNAALPSSAKPLGGWESPSCGLRGHFTGHYLSACARMFAATGDDQFKARIDTLVVELERCQAALGDGYLAAFPQSAFDTLEREFGGGGIWAPYYTIHKILAGLLDAHRYGRNDKAIEVATRLGNWVASRVARVSSEALDPMLCTSSLNPLNEYGGIGEALYDLHSITSKPAFLNTARIFDRDWFLSPLMSRQDELAGLHANTHIPQVLAAARRYEFTSDHRYRQAVEYFWEQTALARSYVNGGSSGPRPDRKERSDGGEHWPNAHQLAKTLTPKINESCVVHNMLRLTDVLFRWSQKSEYANFRERAWLNSVLCMQHPQHCGSYIYSHPMAAGSRKVFGDFDNTFWCCYGTTIEAFAGLADGIYFCDEQTLWINQFVASEVTWARKDVRLTQRTNFPQEQQTSLSVHCTAPAEFTMKLRVPTWVVGARCTLNGQEMASGADGSGYITITRNWRNGDTIELTLPMTLRTEAMPDETSVIAFLFGPIVLAAQTPHGLELASGAPDAPQLVRAADSAWPSLQIRLGCGADVPLVPLSEIVDQAFGIYFKTVPWP